MTGWRCNKCGKAIANGNGYVELRHQAEDGKLGGHPLESSDTRYDRQITEIFGPADKRGVMVVNQMPEPIDAVAITVHHKKCAPTGNSYWFDVERADTLDDWVGWLVHLAGKRWFGSVEVRKFAHLWYEAHEDRPNWQNEVA